MFDSANKLTELNLSNFKTEKVTNMSNMFYNAQHSPRSTLLSSILRM